MKTRTVFTGNTTRNNPTMMSVSKSSLDDYVSRADAVRTAQEIDINNLNDGIWKFSEITEDVRSSSCPKMTSAELLSHIPMMTRGQFPHPNGMAQNRDILTSWIPRPNGLLSGIYYPPYRYAIYPLADWSATSMGAFSEFFYTRNASWNINGSPGTNPESFASLKLKPFWFYESQPELRKATTYFRETSDDSDYTFSNEIDIGYELPYPPYAASQYASTQVRAYVVYGMMGTRVWKCTDQSSIYHGLYSCDAKRNVVFAFRKYDYGTSGDGGTYWGLFRTTVKSRFDAIIEDYGGRLDWKTVPELSGTASGWTPVGMQVYAWPAAIIAIAQAPSRELGS